MIKGNIRVASIVKVIVGPLLLGMCLVLACAGPSSSSNEELWGINTKGELVKVDPLKVCWDTYDPIPKDVKVVLDPAKDQFLYYKMPESDTQKTLKATDSTSAIRPLEDSGSCTCECSTGHCSPTILEGKCACVIQEGCDKCTKTAAE